MKVLFIGLMSIIHQVSGNMCKENKFTAYRLLINSISWQLEAKNFSKLVILENKRVEAI
jgi:hypothetical protein